MESRPLFKNRLQEFCQKHYLENPIYTAVDNGPKNPAVRWVTTVVLAYQGRRIQKTSPPSATKGEAEQKAAYQVLQELGELPDSKDKPPIVTSSPTHPHSQHPSTYTSPASPSSSVPSPTSPFPSTTPTRINTTTTTATTELEQSFSNLSMKKSSSTSKSPSTSTSTSVISTTSSKTPAVVAVKKSVSGKSKARSELTKKLVEQGFLPPQVIFRCSVTLPDGTVFKSKPWNDPLKAEEQASQIALLAFQTELDQAADDDDYSTDEED